MTKTLLFMMIILQLAFMQKQGLAQETVTDHSQVLQVCIDLAELQQYLSTAETADPQLFILNHPVSFAASVTVSKFDQPVVFCSRDDIRSLNPDAFLSFDTFEVGDNEATASYQITYHRLSNDPATVNGQINLVKTSGTWVKNDVTIIVQ